MTSAAPRHQHYDVLVVGGGPAGSSSAIRLTDAGLGVLLVEKEVFPRAKLCGEFVSPECLAHFRELGVETGITEASPVPIRRTVFYSRKGRGVEFPNAWLHPGGHAIGISRAVMDDRLLRRAEAGGADVIEGWTAKSLIISNGIAAGAVIRGPDGQEQQVTAGVVIDAAGRMSPLSSVPATGGPGNRRAPHVAFKAHLTGVEVEPETCELYAYSGGYGGCSPVEDGRWNICFIVEASRLARASNDPLEVMRRAVGDNARARRVIERCDVESAWLSVPIRGFGKAPAVDTHISIGDAAAFIDPFTGSGILMALQSARLAAEAVLDGIRRDRTTAETFAAYAHAHREHFRHRLRVAAALRTAAFSPRVAGFLLTSLGSTRFVRRMVARATRT